jgi:putative ATP-dependent endonuclease of OLD family
MGNVDGLVARLEGERWTAGIIGLGYVGLPLAMTASRAGLDVIGFDVAERRIADLNAVECLVETSAGVEVFHPRSVSFGKGKKEKLKRYLDVTRAEIFFARRVIFVEGAAELMMIDLLAKRVGYDLRDHGVSLISVEGLNFDSFMPLFGGMAIKIPVAVITDADPFIVGADGKTKSHYPSATENITISSNTAHATRHYVMV